jgi:hypothetical protein
VRLFAETDLGALDGIEIAIEVTNLFVDGRPQGRRNLDVSVANGDLHAHLFLLVGSLFYGSDVADLVFVPTLAWRYRPTVGRAAFRTYF